MKQGRLPKHPRTRSGVDDPENPKRSIVGAAGVSAGSLPVASTFADAAKAAIAAADETDEPAERARLIADLHLFRDMTIEAVEQMSLGFVALDRDLHVTYANPAALGLVGKSLKELAGERPYDLFPQIVGTRYQTFRSSAGITAEYEEQIGPRERWVGILGCPTQTGIAVFLRDITARKRAEESVRRSMALLHGSLDAMLDAFILCSAVRDEEGALVTFQIEFANSVAAAFLGRAPDTLMGVLIPDWTPNLDGLPFLDACRRIVETGEAWAENAVDYAIPGPEGTVLRGTLDIQIARFNDGFFAVWRDATERERTSRERGHLVAIIADSVDGIVITDPDRRITYANRALLAYLGYELAELVGLQMPGALTAGLDPATLADIVEAITAERSWRGEVDQAVPDGSRRRVEVSITPGRDLGGVISGWVNVFRDVTDLREAQAEVALEGRIRLALAETLHAIPDDASLEQAAQAICDQLVTLPFIDLAVIEVFLDAEDVLLIGLRGPSGYPIAAGDHLPPTRAAIERRRTAEGPWAAYAEVDPADAGWSAGAVGSGLKAHAHGPIVHADVAIGALFIGTLDERFARTMVEKMPGIASFGTASSALLAERMSLMRRTAELHASITAILAAQAFHPVFQPIVDLESGEVVGYEALTRFDSGQRPDHCFADAWSVGLGAELEFATLEAALEAATRLTAGVWLDLNLSPRLVADPERLRAALWEADRPIVLEITEHDLIEDYDLVRDAIRGLGHDIRLAVDDAGAGVANFGHIIDLRPDFVKLDIGLVRRVNAHLGRQAMVIGMRHFSRSAGCRLIAEGVETVEEARTLTALGVEFGQGYLFGRPEPVEMWAASAGGKRGQTR